VLNADLNIAHLWNGGASSFEVQIQILIGLRRTKRGQGADHKISENIVSRSCVIKAD
jgi:hypothetical protein